MSKLSDLNDQQAAESEDLSDAIVALEGKSAALSDPCALERAAVNAANKLAATVMQIQTIVDGKLAECETGGV